MSDQGQPMPLNFAAQNGASRGISFLPNGAPIVANMNDMQGAFNTTQWGNWEFVNQTLYDSAVYPAAGTTGLAFFQTPVGSGTGFGGSSKTLSDTNMTLNGMLSSGNMFVINTVEVEFQPSTPTTAANMPAVFGAQAVAAQINDAYIFWRSGNFKLNILQKKYLQEAPLMRLPSAADFSLQAALADATTAAATQQSRIGFASSYGSTYNLAPNNLLIPSNTNFEARTDWPEGVQAISAAARVFVRLGGMQARVAQ